MPGRGRPRGRAFTQKLEVWFTQKQLDELDAFCEIHMGVSRSEILRRAVLFLVKHHTEKAPMQARFRHALTEVRRMRGEKTDKLRVVAAVSEMGSTEEAEE